MTRVLCILLITGGLASGGSIVYSNFGAGQSYSAGNGLIVTNDPSAGASIAVSFTPSANYNLSSIEFVATNSVPDDSTDLTVGIFADNGGQPGGTALESFTVDPLDQFGDLAPVMTVTSVLEPLLQANTLYWVALDSPTGDLVVWNQNTTLATGFSSTDGSGNWSSSNQTQGVVEIDGTLASTALVAFNQDAEAPIPEPVTWWLMATGLGAIGCSARRRRGRHALRQPGTTIR